MVSNHDEQGFYNEQCVSVNSIVYNKILLQLTNLQFNTAYIIVLLSYIIAYIV